MLFNLESDSIYESEMIKVKSHGINDMFVAKNSKRFFILSKIVKCVNYMFIVCSKVYLYR